MTNLFRRPVLGRGSRRGASLLLGLGLVLAACGGEGVAAEPTADTAPATTITEASTTTTEATTTTTTTIPAAEARSIVGFDGVEAVVDDVSRIIPISGSIAEIVWELGFGDNIVATDISATYPAELDNSPKIGYQRTLSAEGLLSFQPTLLIGAESAGPPEVIAQLRDAGVPVLILESYHEVADISQKIHDVASALGVEERGRRLAERVQGEIDEALALAATATEQPRAAFIYARGPNTIFLSGEGTIPQSMIEAAGAIDVGAAFGIEGFVPLTPEAIVTANPDVLVLLTAGLESLGGIDGLLEVPGVHLSNAGRTRTVFAYDDLSFRGLTPRVGQVLLAFVRDLHGITE